MNPLIMGHHQPLLVTSEGGIAWMLGLQIYLKRLAKR